MTDLDKQIETLISERNDFERQVVALKTQVTMFRQVAIELFNGGWDGAHSLAISGRAKEAFNSTPEQCLNSVKADAVDDALSLILSISDGDMCFDILTDRVNELRAKNESTG